MSDRPVDYRSTDDDNSRWLDFEHRDDDIVISTRSKHGTTWMQMICALLVFQTPELPAPLRDLSPWLDWLVLPRDEAFARLAAQTHRRFIKTHTPLDGLPLDPRVTYIVVARHPLDGALSLFHHRANIDRARQAELTGQPAPSPSASRTPASAREWLLEWIEADPEPVDALESLPGVMHHLADAWTRQDTLDIVLVHYDDLLTDLAREMNRLARRLGIVVEPDWPDLVEAARFESMRRHTDQLAPDRAGVLIDRDRFFRSGRSGEGRALLTPAELARYHQRAASLAPPDLVTWLHRT